VRAPIRTLLDRQIRLLKGLRSCWYHTEIDGMGNQRGGCSGSRESSLDGFVAAFVGAYSSRVRSGHHIATFHVRFTACRSKPRREEVLLDALHPICYSVVDRCDVGPCLMFFFCCLDRLRGSAREVGFSRCLRIGFCNQFAYYYNELGCPLLHK